MEHLERSALACLILLLLAYLWLVLKHFTVLASSILGTLLLANLACALALLSLMLRQRIRLMLPQVLSSGIVCSMLANNANLVVA